MRKGSTFASSQFTAVVDHLKVCMEGVHMGDGVRHTCIKYTCVHIVCVHLSVSPFYTRSPFINRECRVKVVVNSKNSGWAKTSTSIDTNRINPDPWVTEDCKSHLGAGAGGYRQLATRCALQSAWPYRQRFAGTGRLDWNRIFGGERSPG